jgi:hypothetical protein
MISEHRSADGAIPSYARPPRLMESMQRALNIRSNAPIVREALERLQRVVVEHIKRFAFREDLGEVQWTPTN